MATKTTRITQQDLQIYPSERMTDTDDGGGLMTGTALTGADNEVFPPVSDVDRTMGSFDARLLYPAVLRSDAEPFYGAHFIISEPPEAENVSFLAFKARNYGEERADIMPYIAAYSVPTIESRMTLLGKHMAGIRIIQAYQRTDATLPKVGERYCLEKGNTQEYFRIAAVSSEVRTFEYVNSDGSVIEFQRTVLNMEITSALTNDYSGIDYPVRGYANIDVAILETQVADSASYYGVRPLAKAISQNDAVIYADSVYEKLVPTSTIETAYTDNYPVESNAWVASGATKVLYSTNSTVSGTIYLSQPVIPGTVSVSGYTDNALGQLVGTSNTISVDYERGILQNVPSTYALRVTGTPGAKVSAARYATYIAVKDSNQGTAWVPLLTPAPVSGSLTVSYMSGGDWYVLSDKGDGILRDDEGDSCGTVAGSGSVALSLPATPDVGSYIVLAWADSAMYQTYDAQKAGSTPAAKTVSGSVVMPSEASAYIKPGTFTLSWNDGESDKTAGDNAGALTGDATGRVGYYYGQAVLTGWSSMNPVKISFEEYTGTPEVVNQTFSDKAAAVSLTVGKTAPGSLLLALAYTVNVTVADTEWVKALYNSYSVGDSALGGVILARAKHDILLATDEEEDKASFTVNILDDGAGNLLNEAGQAIGGTIDYTTGKITLPSPAAWTVAPTVTGGTFAYSTIAVGAAAVGAAETKTITDYQIYATEAAWSRIAESDTKLTSVTETPSNVQINVALATGGRPVLDTWSFNDGSNDLIERGGTIYKSFNGKTGTGTVVGSLNSDSGAVKFSATGVNVASLKITGGIVATDTDYIQSYSGRTEAAPVKPESFTVYAVVGGQKISGTSDGDGNITGGISGTIDYETGFYSITCANGFYPETLRYNCVTQDNIPLDSDIIGIDAVRLPADGKVPVFRKGDMIVIGNRLKQDLGSAFTSGQVIQLERKNLDRMCLLDANGEHVLAEKYSVDLETGVLTMAEPLSLADYTLPLTAVLAWEEENRITGVDISGRLKLQFAVSRDYPLENTYVSSALIGGDLLVRATDPFSQNTWDNVWSDSLRGTAILAQLDVKNYPITLTSSGAINERWLIQFISATQFQLYGENLGLVAQADIYTDLAPANPATGKPYFSLQAAAFGGGWAAKNCIRFNTFGTPLPVWVLRAVQPSAARQTERDGFTACLRGNTVAE
ncbi:hypothetical protein [Neisseria perflava]|uniref:hypothetical protein n=1 Tax=Neisseria perflava TaxID=33053 RepID=UPI0020A1F172|nr:hypothetical protein [Neisseria perflava]MCP1659347.1 hypothetical protein [Neisseria perflava]